MLTRLIEVYKQRLELYHQRLLMLIEQPMSCSALAEIKHTAHRLAGSGRAYDFPEVSYTAKCLERYCESLEGKFDAGADERLMHSLKHNTHALLDSLQNAISAGSQPPDRKRNRPETFKNEGRYKEKKLLLIDDDTEFSVLLAADLKGNGYRVDFLADIKDLADAIDYYHPDAILVDMEFYGERLAGANQVTAWKERSGYPLPVFFISAHDSFDVRLAAVQAGGHHFLSKPVDLHRLLGLLERELGAVAIESTFRVLLVDDDEDLLALYEAALSEEGYSVALATSGEQALSVMAEFNPELILIDVFMPGCSGIELGHLIRQHAQYFDTQLLFMSASADTDIQLACARLASDEFISKPIELWRLKMVVKSRLVQGRRQNRLDVTKGSVEKGLYDRLTALPMLDKLQQRITELLSDNNQTGALLKLDIRDFHTINNLYGPFKGDELLQEIAWRLTEVLINDGSVYRAGGDEFYVLIEQCNSPMSISKITEEIVHALAKRYELDTDNSISVVADIGIAKLGVQATSTDMLIARAETALFKAKAQSSPAILYFDETMRESELARFSLGQALESAFSNNEFVAFFQPIFSVRAQGIVGFEALARWQHPQQGLIPPNQFISALEEKGFIRELTVVMLRASLTSLKLWQQQNPNLFMSVNLSARDIENPSFLDVLSELIKAHEIQPQSVVLEITETTLLSNWQQASKVINLLKEMGVKLALDDFGTGYSSLSYLNRINADKLKIDRSFVDAWSKTGDARLLRTMVQLGQGMGMKVVAEGVEQQSELAFLQELSCDYYQGFLSAKPMLASDISQWILQQ